MTKSVKILDCTLRDGGYIIDWDFSKANVTSILDGLSSANIDFVEAGFLKICQNNPDKTFWTSIDEFAKHINSSQNYTLMVNYGEYPIENFKY